MNKEIKEDYPGQHDKRLQAIIKSWQRTFPKSEADLRMAILDGYEIGKTGKIAEDKYK